jgi:hypothetical protein
MSEDKKNRTFTDLYIFPRIYFQYAVPPELSIARYFNVGLTSGPIPAGLIPFTGAPPYKEEFSVLTCPPER